MKLENYNTATLVVGRLDSNLRAVENITLLLDKYPNGDSDGETTTKDKKLYGLHISEHSDGSGIAADLAGSMVQTAVLNYTLKLLRDQIEKDKAFIETL